MQLTEDIEAIDRRTIAQLYHTKMGGIPSVYVPVFGGVKYHILMDCCDMIDPELVPLEVAIALGYTPCWKCYHNVH